MASVLTCRFVLCSQTVLLVNLVDQYFADLMSGCLLVPSRSLLPPLLQQVLVSHSAADSASAQLLQRRLLIASGPAFAGVRL